MPRDDDAARSAARHAYVLGHPQRIAPLTAEEFTPEAKALTAKIDRAVELDPDEHVSEWTATVLRHPVLFRAHTELAVLLMDGKLPARDRELAILRTGWLAQAPFEWSAHVELAKRIAGMTTEEIEWVTIGSAAPGWGEHDRAVLRAVEELRGNAMISDETWAVLARDWDEIQLLEFPLLVGQYLGVAFLQNSVRVVLPEGYTGLLAR